MANASAWLLSLLLLSLLLLIPQKPANAGIFACQSPDGATVFQDKPCPRIERVTASPATDSRTLPLDAHASWFERPSEAQGRVFCDKKACECGNSVYQLPTSLDEAVAESLYLESKWLDYDLSVQSLMDTRSGGNQDFAALASVIDASCAVMISQTVLRKFATSTIEELQQQVRQAEQLGFDDPSACDNGNEQACGYYDAVLRLQQIMFDADVLQLPRESLLDTTLY